MHNPQYPNPDNSIRVDQPALVGFYNRYISGLITRHGHPFETRTTVFKEVNGEYCTVTYGYSTEYDEDSDSVGVAIEIEERYPLYGDTPGMDRQCIEGRIGHNMIDMEAMGWSYESDGLEATLLDQSYNTDQPRADILDNEPEEQDDEDEGFLGFLVRKKILTFVKVRRSKIKVGRKDIFSYKDPDGIDADSGELVTIPGLVQGILTCAAEPINTDGLMYFDGSMPPDMFFDIGLCEEETFGEDAVSLSDLELVFESLVCMRLLSSRYKLGDQFKSSW
jgi:hypothetical protein